MASSWSGSAEGSAGKGEEDEVPSTRVKRHPDMFRPDEDPVSEQSKEGRNKGIKAGRDRRDGRESRSTAGNGGGGTTDSTGTTSLLSKLDRDGTPVGWYDGLVSNGYYDLVVKHLAPGNFFFPPT